MGFMTPELALARSLNAEIVAARRTQRGAEHRLALLLARMGTEKLFRPLGYTSLAAYARIVLELSAKATWDLARLGRRLAELPILDRAMAEGVVDWTKAREISRILTPENEAAWVEHARTHNAREVERDANYSKFGDMPPTGEPAPDQPPQRRRMVLDLDAADYDTIVQGLALARFRGGLTPDEADDGVLIAALVRSNTDELKSEHPPTGERYRVVIHHCDTCKKTEGASEAVIGEALCDCQVVDMRPGPDEGTGMRTIPLRKRWKVLHRAGWKCEVPGCHNKFWLDIHHVDGWVRVRRHEYSRLVAVCCAHHRAVHEGWMALGLTATGQVSVKHGDGRAAVGPVRVETEERTVPRGTVQPRRRYPQRASRTERPGNVEAGCDDTS